MALTEGCVADHIARWTDDLASGLRAYRKHWPSCLFHHAPLENALSILRDGHLRSRNDPERERIRDVAAPGVIENAYEAHDRVRLYFRPRTPTQFHIEGIRKAAECQFGAQAHAPVLVMFVLDSAAILADPNVMFSDRNMQRGDRRIGSDNAFFGTIPFEKVFHEGGIGGDNSVIAHRCAEVLPTSPLALGRVLKGIWFRSEPERDTLLYQLGANRSDWEKYCRVSEELKVFDKRFAFVNEIGLSAEGVSFRLNNRHDFRTVNLRIIVHNTDGSECIDFRHSEHPTHNGSGGRWIYRRALEPSKYLVRVYIEGHLGFEGRIDLEDSLI